MVGATQILGGKVSAQIIKRTSLKATTLFSNAMWILGMALMGCSRNTTQAFVALFVWTFGHNRNTPVASYMQKYGAAQNMGRGEIIAAQGNFAAATSNGRNMPGLPYFVICFLTALSQCTFKIA